MKLIPGLVFSDTGHLRWPFMVSQCQTLVLALGCFWFYAHYNVVFYIKNHLSRFNVYCLFIWIKKHRKHKAQRWMCKLSKKTDSKKGSSLNTFCKTQERSTLLYISVLFSYQLAGISAMHSLWWCSFILLQYGINR